jgi:cell division protein FtsB
LIRVSCFTLYHGQQVISFSEVPVDTKCEASMRKAFVIAALAVLTAASLLGTLSGTVAGFGAYKEQRVLATTVQIERLAAKLEHAKHIEAETKVEIARLTHGDWSDCAKAGCRMPLEVRNRAARERLQTVISGNRDFAEPACGAKRD